MPNILIVDDERSMRRSLGIALEQWNYTVTEAASGEEAIEAISNDVYDIILTDLVMREISGVDLLRKVNEISPTSEVVLMSAHGTIPQAVEAMQEGASDFITKPFSMDHLKLTIEKANSQRELKQTVRHLRAVLAEHYLVDDIIAVSSAMKDVMHQVSMVANWSVPVLIQGASGVGKELVAMAVHHLSQRDKKAFIPINCGAFPETLLDSELFGHCKGAFTGASVNKRGLIEEANGGTLFLDEIGEAPPALQVRLLRFLDNGHFRRIGETTERKSDVRIIAATNRDLAENIKLKLFREDLYYRLSVAVITIPPLRDRKDDIPPLCQRFLETYSKRMERPLARLHPQVYQVFQNYSWPGNVRELENTIEHALIVAKTNEIQVNDLPAKFQEISDELQGFQIDGDPSLKEVEKRYILSILKKVRGNKKHAASILKISRTTLISRLKSYHINSPNRDEF